MTANNMSVDLVRRRFMWKAGTALAAPMAIAVPWTRGVAAVPSEATLEARVALFEEQNAIRAVARAYTKYVNGIAGAGGELALVCVSPAAVRLPGVRTLTPDLSGADDAIEIGAGGRTATAWLRYAADTERPIEPYCPLVEMARAQGGGVVSRTERGVLEASFVKLDGFWKIEGAAFRAV